MTNKIYSLDATRQKIKNAFAKKAFIPFFTAGDPNITSTEQFIRKAVEAGASVIEVGIPFSDPVAEGPVIQAASERALAGGLKTNCIFAMIKSLRTGEIEKGLVPITVPIIIMTYINPIYVYGADKFFNDCADVGVDAVIVPDCPFEEKKEIEITAHKYGICIISMIAPTSENRIEMVAKEAEGFIYCVSSLGVTGVRAEFKANVADIIETVRKHTDIPVAIGFGISTPIQAKSMATFSDGIIVGSAVVDIIAKQGDASEQAVYDYVKSMVEAVKESDCI